MEYARPDLLAEPGWLADHANDPDVRIIDCATVEAYRRAHIPGAVQLPVHFYIKDEDSEGSDHGTFVMKLPAFESLMSQLGIGEETTVVTYDDNNALVASRLWWALNFYGHTKVRVLNGGWHRWLSENRPVTFHATRPPRATFTARPVEAVHASSEDLLASYDDPACQVLDVRSDGEWEGTNSRGNRRSGHVPNARHLEWTRFVETSDTRRFLPADQIEALLEEAGITRAKPTITYCQGGIRAAHAAFVMALVGYDNVRVYDGSMRDWANRDDTPLV
ncbi:MAG: sulfurtransferase [Tepidiformaceae bacterium]